MKNAIFLLGFIVIIISNSACNRTDTFSGNWHNCKSKNDKLLIKKQGQLFIATDGEDEVILEKKETGILTGMGGLVSIRYDKATDHLFITDPDETDEYCREITDKSLSDNSPKIFLGEWSHQEGIELLDISKSGNDYKVIWKSKDDMYQSHEIICKYLDNSLLGSYYGSENNFKINIVPESNDAFLYLSINPFGEFEPIVNKLFAKK